MKTEKEVQELVDLIKDKAFEIIEKSQYVTNPKAISMKNLYMVVDTLEYILGKRKESKILKEIKNGRKKNE